LNQEPAPIDDTAAEQIDREQPTTEQDQLEESGLEFDLVPKEVLERDLFGNRCIKGAITVLDIVRSVSFFLLVRGIYSRFTGN
jgi:hypothetical protein